MFLKIIFVKGLLLGLSMGVPVKSYHPQDFYATSQRIHGGVEAPEAFAPYMMALLVGEVFISMMCGASLVGPRRALTAAHCLEPLLGPDGELLPSVRGVVGTNSWSDERTAYLFSGHQIHPDYDRWNIKNDVGVAFLSEEVVLTDRVGVIALNFDWVGGGERIHVTGWGSTVLWGGAPSQLQLLHVSSLSPRQCEAGAREAQAVLGPSPPLEHAVELCTRHEDGAGYGMCHGDSGSPLVDSRGRQVGVVSWGWPCALGHPDVHARVGGLRDFLEPLLAD